MHKAYDCVLQTIVTAEDAVINRGFEPYRYECLCCGEEVRLAAPFSEQRAPHFRHLSGNNDTECEEYFGLGEARLSKRGERRGHREVAEIFYSNVKKAFMLKIKFAEEELGRVIILLNSNVEIKKSELLAMFYRSYINEEIDWSTFCEFSDITSRLFISDLQLLYEIYRGNISDTSQCPVYKADRLIALGLLDSAMKSMSIGSVSGSQTQRYIQTNNLGKQFCSITLS